MAMKNVLALGAAAVIAGLPVLVAVTGGAASDATPSSPGRSILPEQSAVSATPEPAETAAVTASTAPAPLPPPLPVPGGGDDDDDDDSDDEDDEEDDD